MKNSASLAGGLVFLSLMVGPLGFADEPGVSVDVRLSPAGTFKATTDEVKGVAVREGEGVRAENIVVNLKNLRTGIELRDKHTKEKYLETEKFPEAVLIKANGKNGKGKGLLRIRGIEKEIEGVYAVSGGHLSADFPVKLSDYGISGVKYMGVGVDDTIKLHVVVPVKP